jgi:hypothetical protein
MADAGDKGPVGMPDESKWDLTERGPVPRVQPPPQQKPPQPPAHDCYALVRHPVKGNSMEYRCPSCGAEYVVTRKQQPSPQIGAPKVGGV